MSENPLLLTLIGCVFQGLGQTLQKHAVSRGSERSAGLLRIFGTTIVNGTWLLGFATMVGGSLLVLQALAYGDIAVVLPLSNLTVVVTILTGVLVLREQLSPREWAGVSLMLLGSATFLTSSSQSPSSDPLLPPDTLLLGAVLFGMFGAVVLAGLRAKPGHRALVFGIGSGLLQGFAVFLQKYTTTRVRLTTGEFQIVEAGTIEALALEPLTYLVIVGNLVAFLTLQAAYTRGRLSVVYPLRSILALVFGVLLGLAVFGEHMSALRVAGTVAIVFGMWFLLNPTEVPALGPDANDLDPGDLEARGHTGGAPADLPHAEGPQ